MRLLFICKRHPQQRDLLKRPYGRFHYIPQVLAEMGHEVHIALISHHGKSTSEVIKRKDMNISAYDIRYSGPIGLLNALKRNATAYKPDWVIGFSDAWIGWLAYLLSKECGAYLGLDAYDNFESYMPWNMPVHALWRSAIKHADVVTAAGPQLAVRLDLHRKGKSTTKIIPMSADPSFVPHDRAASRSRLDLPFDIPLIGYFGSWAKSRGTDVLLNAFRRVRTREPYAQMILTGHPPQYAISETGAHSLGYIDDVQLPIALSAVNVACVITTNSSFGHYSYPAKLCEAMACQTPVVATATDPVRWMLRDDLRFLASVGDERAIADRILALLSMDRIAYPSLPTWEASARLFEAALLSAS